MTFSENIALKNVTKNLAKSALRPNSAELGQIHSRSEPPNTPNLTKSRGSYYLCCWASLRFDPDRLGLLLHDLAAISVCSELLRQFPERFRITPLRAAVRTARLRSAPAQAPRAPLRRAVRTAALRSVNRNRSGNWLRNSPHTPILPNHSRSGQIDPDRSSALPNSIDSYNL